MKPPATHREERFDGKRTFLLHPDRLAIVGKQSLGGEFEAEIPLRNLVPIANRMRSREPGFLAGMGMIIVSIGPLQSGSVSLCPYWGGLSAGIGIGGALMSAATIRKAEWVQIGSHTGFIAVSIASSGPDRADFHRFIGVLIGQKKRLHLHPPMRRRLEQSLKPTPPARLNPRRT